MQKFGNVKGEIDHGKANRVHTMAKRKERNNDPQSTTQKATFRTTDQPGINSTNPMTYVKL